MKQKTTFSLWKRLLLLLVLLVPLSQTVGQTRVDAPYLKHNTYGRKVGGVITNVDALKSADQNDFATINTYGGALLGLGRYGGSIEFQFEKDIPANQWSYIRIGADQGLLQGLLGGSLGKLLGGVVGSLALGNQDINVEVFDSKTNKVVLQSSSLHGFDTDRVKLIETGEGQIVLAVKPITTYKKIKISNVCNTLLLGVENFTLDVYGVYTIAEDSNSCGKPIGTSYSGSGLSLSVLEAQNQHLGYAIDDNRSTSSLLSSGSLLSLNVGGSIAQQFYFPTTTGPKGSVNVRLSLGGEGVLNLNLLGGVEILAYNGTSTAPVFQKTLSGGLISDLNLLNLLKLGKDATVTVAPQKDFDRIEVRMNLPVNVNLLGASVRIYDVERYDGVTCMNPALVIPEPTVEPFEVTSCSTKLGAFDNAEFPLNAVDGNNETFTTLSASNGSLLVKAPYSGKIEMKYDSPLKANKTSYIRIDTDKEVLDALLGGSLGKLVADLGGLLLGKHIISVEAFNDKGNPIAKTSSSNGFDGSSNGFVRLVQDNIGRYYLAVTPNQVYQSIVVSNSVGSLLPTGEIRELKVYNMCTETGTDICFPAQFTSYDISGVSLSLADLSKAGVKNPYHAISSNSSNYSEVNAGLLGVGTKVSQRVYFNHPSETNSTLTVKAFLNPANVLDLDILGRYSIVTSLNGVKQNRFTLKEGLLNNIDVLGLFKRGSAYTFNFKTTKQYDRVDIVVESLVKVGISPALRVYNVNRYSDACPLPTTENPFTQSVCATTVVSEDHADNSMNVVDGNFDSYATIHSNPGALLSLGDKYSGHIEMAYDHTVAAGKTSYVRFDFDDTVLDGLLGGSLGNVVTGLLDHLLLGAHYFDIDVKDENGLTVLQGSSKGELTSFIKNGSIRIVRDKVGRTYIAITPTVPYKSVRITDKTEAVVGILAAPGSMNVYGMCYEESTDPCLSAFATSYELSGLGLDVKDLSGAGVKYPERAIDSNTTNYSEISTGTLNLAGSVRQYIYFNTPSKVDDVVMIKFKTQGGQVNASLLGSIEIKAFLGDKEVATLPINRGLINGVNVADLLTNNKIVELPFTPGVSYDRISVGMKSLVGVTVGANLHLYDVERTCKALPQTKKLVSWKSYKVNGDSTIKAVAGKETVEYTIHVRNEGTEDISSFTITDKLPQGLTFVSTNDGAFTEGNVVFSSKKNLAPGEVTIFVFTALVADNLDGIDIIKNIAYTQFDLAIPATASFPPKDNANPRSPDTAKEPGTIILVNQCLVPTPKPVVVGDMTDGLICQGSFITLSSNIDADDYQWFLDGNKLDKQVSESKTDNGKTFVTDKGGVYTLMVKRGKCWSEESDIFIVNQKPLPVITITGEREFMVKIDELVTYPVVSSIDGIVQWFDPKGNSIAELPKSFDTPGIYPFTAIVEKDGCTTTETIIVTVYDNTACPPTTKRVYAQGTGDWKTTWYTTLLGGVSNKENAVDANPTTHSTITLGLVVAGLGTTWQNMYFGGNEIPAGTPVSVKLGNEYSLLGVGDGITVVGLDKNGKDIGVVKAVGGGLLKLLTADNVYEYTFVPSDKTGPKAYYGVKVIYSALLGAGANMKIYGAYYNELGDSCSTSDYVPSDKVNIPSGVHPQILDIHHGIQDIGLGVATSLSPFVNPWRAVDKDPDSYAYINRSVAVINAATLTVLFKQQSMPGDELHIDIEDSSNPVLSLDLLKGFSIQRYLGDKKVGPQLDAGGSVLGLKLLGLGKGARRRIIVTPYDKPFDKVKIFYGNIVSVLGSETKIYDVSLNPQILKESIDLDKYYDVCFGGIFTIENNDGCTEFRVFTDITKTVEIITKNGKDFNLSKKLPLGQHSIYVQGYRNGCEVGHLQEVKINHKNCSVKSNLNITHKIK